MKRGVFFVGYSYLPWWQHAKTRCVLEIYAVICISGNTQIFKIKIFHHQNIVLLTFRPLHSSARGGGGHTAYCFHDPFVLERQQNPPIHHR